MKKLLGYFFALIGAWMLISPQALTGLRQLRWMHDYAFPGEALAGMLALCLAYHLLDLRTAPGKPPPPGEKTVWVDIKE